jgi:hypothetical protein
MKYIFDFGYNLIYAAALFVCGWIFSKCYNLLDILTYLWRNYRENKDIDFVKDYCKDHNYQKHERLIIALVRHCLQ